MDKQARNSQKISDGIDLFEICKWWKLSDNSLDMLRRKYLGHADEDIVRTKMMAVNSLYSARAHRLEELAHNIQANLGKGNARGAALVDRIARTEGEDGIIRFRSFASKYCHFFVSPRHYPILDSAVIHALKKQAGFSVGEGCDYVDFYEKMRKLQGAIQCKADWRHIDKFLYIRGNYIRYEQNPKTQLNPELKRLFKMAVNNRALQKKMDNIREFFIV